MTEAATRAGRIDVRRARPDDLPAVMDLLGALSTLQERWRVFPPREGFQEEFADLYRRAIEDPSGAAAVLVALDGGRVVGSAFAHLVVPSSFSDEAAMELSGVFVLATHRRRGVGRALAAEVGRFAKGRGIDRVVVKTFASNQEALRHWEALGFRPRMVQLVARAGDLAEDGPS